MAFAASSNPDFIAAMSGVSGVDAVVPDFLVELPDAGFNDEIFSHDPIPYAGGTDLDGLLWGLDAVNAPEAWDDGVDGAGVRVAVLDAGIDADHPDFSSSLNASLSTSFTPCLFGLNCNSSGFENWNISPGFYFNHGTHTSGTIAAANDGNGVTGVAPGAEVVAVKVCTEFANACFTSAIINGLVYAADIDADLVNMSLGGLRIFGNDWWMPYCRDVLGLPQNICGQLASQYVIGQADYIQTVITAYMRAFEYAFRGGTTVIVSAGNSAMDGDHNEDAWLAFSDYPHTISVSALGPVGWCLDPSTNVDTLSYYSNYGRSVIDVAAPGGNFFAAVAGISWANDPCTVAGITRPVFAFDGVMSTISQGWGWAQGTSMAAPHATGIAALIISENGGNMRPAQVESKLKSLSEDLGDPGVDPIYGAGRVHSGHK